MEETLGSYLRKQRLQRGLSLEAIAGETRVPLQYLQGLEEDDLSKLPGAIVLAKAYLRSYVRCLRLSTAVEDHAMAYLADSMVAARDDHQPAVSESRRGLVTLIIDLYYGLLVTWTLRRQQCFGAVFARASVVGQMIRNTGRLSLAWTMKVMQITGLMVASLARQALIRIRIASRVARQAIQTGLEHYSKAAVRPAISASQAALGTATSLSGALVRQAGTVSEGAVLLTTSALQRGSRVLLTFACVALAHARAVLAEGIRRVLTGVKTVHGESLSYGQMTVKLIGMAFVRMSSVVTASMTSVLSLTSVISSILILSLITLARAISRTFSRAVVSAAHLYEFMRHSTYFPQPVAPVGMDQWCEVGAHSAMSNPAGLVRPTYLTSTLLPPASQPRPEGLGDRPAGSGRLAFRDITSYERLRMGAWDMRAWYWVVNYVVALTMAVLLAAILGDAPLFRSTMLGDTSINASRLVQFIGYGASLWLFWLLGLRVAGQIPDAPLLPGIIRRLMTPLVTLVTFSGLYKVLLLLGDPFLTKSGRQLYDWTFVIMIMGSAAWVTMAGFWMVHNVKGTAELPAGAELERDAHQSCSPLTIKHPSRQECDSADIVGSATS
jgi:Helix-turn-helix domain